MESEETLKKRNLKILVVDDSPDNSNLLGLYLRKYSSSVEIALNGQEALSKVQTHTYDIILMDIQMPEMDGYTATKLIRKWEVENKRPPLFIIACTAHALDDDKFKSLNAGCDDYLAKPISKTSLINKLLEFLDRQH